MIPTFLTTLEVALPLVYLAALASYAHHFFQDDERSQKLSRILLYAILITHTGYTVLRGLEQHAWPLGSKAEFLSLLALSITCTYALTERGEEEAHTGMFFLGITLPFQIAASVMMEAPPDQTHQVLLEHPVYGIHVIFTMLGFAALAVGALDAVMYILLSRQLKRRELGLFFQRLPPLMKLEEMSRLATTAGIFLLGIGLGLGHFVAGFVLEDFNPWDPKIVIMDLAWISYVIGMITVKLRGLGGLRIGYLALGAYVGLMITMILSNILLTSFHSFQG